MPIKAVFLAQISSMITRRHVRIKAAQSIYALLNDSERDLQDEVQFFQKSIQNSQELFLLSFDFIRATYREAEAKQQALQKLRVPDLKAEAELQAILSNDYFIFLMEHPIGSKKGMSRRLKHWDLEFEYVKKIYQSWEKSDAFQTYTALESPNKEEQHQFLLHYFKHFVATSDRLAEHYEDLQLTWADDLPLVNTHMLRQLKAIRLNDPASFQFPEFSNRSEEIVFGVALLEKTFTQNDLLQKEFENKTPNWDADRIAQLDAILIKMALAELLYFEEIPPRVTLNEYLEIAKDYSTPKSNQFINGLLDKLVKEFKENNRLLKSGRGLR
ncbi:MAG: transcription antitermination protein NusB [Flavobacteriaceae bacterium]